jgi:hypothetical protein
VNTAPRGEWLRRLKEADGLPDRAKYGAWHISGFPVRGRPGVYSRSHEDIGWELNWSPATVERNLRLALSAGWLKIVDPGHRGQAQTYALTIPNRKVIK